MPLVQDISNACAFLSGTIRPSDESESAANLGDFPVESLMYADANKAILAGKDFRSGRPARFVVFPARSFEPLKVAESIRVDHPHVDPFERVEAVNGLPVLVLPSIKAMPLENVAAARPIPFRHALRIARQTLEALAAAHSKGILHGFLSSRWIWLEGSKANVRVVGLGWRTLEPPDSGSLASYLTSAIQEPISPEAAEGKPVDARTDLFAVGAMLFRMLTNTDPYPGDSPLAVIRSLAVHDPAPPSSLGVESSPKLDRFVLDLLARDPARRPTGAAEAAGRLLAIEKDLAANEPHRHSQEESPDNGKLVAAVSCAAPEPAEPRMETLVSAPIRQEPFVPDDSMTIELLPIDDEPVAAAVPASTDPKKTKPQPSRKSAESMKAASSYDRFPVPLEWVYLADNPVSAIHLCGESQTIFIRESSGRLVILSAEGDVREVHLSPKTINLSAADESGQLLALVVDKTKLVLLDGDGNLLVEKALHSEPLALAVDALGLYVAVSFQGNETRLYARSGKPAGNVETRQPLVHLGFVPGTARLLGSTKFDQFLAIDFEKDRGQQLKPEVAWTRNTGVAFAHMHVIGGAEKVLASCNVMGLQRLDVDGENEGTYQLGGTVIEAAGDFTGRFFLASTLEGSLMAVNVNGTILWEHTRGGPWRRLCVDPLGRYALAASNTGEVVKMNLSTEARDENIAEEPVIITATGKSTGSTIRHAEWSLRVADENESETGYDLCIVEEPLRICLFDPKKKLTCFNEAGEEVETVPSLGGIGRMTIVRDDWVAVANDRTLVLLDVGTSRIFRPDLDLVQITHFDMRPRSYGLAIVQEADRLGRATAAGRWIWRVTLPATVESMVLADDGHIALSLDNGLLLVLDEGGREVGRWSAGEQEAVLACESRSRNVSNCRWMSLSRQERTLRGHAANSHVLWQSEVPIRAWNLQRTDEGVIVSDNMGEAILYDDTGQIIVRRRPEPGRTLFGSSADGQAVALRSNEGQVFLTRFDGAPIWRYAGDSEVAALALGRRGAAILAGGVLSWVGDEVRSLS